MKSIICTSILKILQSLRAFCANIWNTLPEYIKSTTSFLEFKKFIKTWPWPKYKCSVCKWEWNFLLNMIFRYAHHFAKMNSEHCQASEVELFVKTVNYLKPLKAVTAKRSTLGIWRDSEHASSFAKLCIWKGGGFSQ